MLKAMGRPPLKTVAGLAGVSEPTVSRVLNARPGVAAETRARVVDALGQLGYDAPELAPARRNTIGVVTGELTNPVFPTIAHHLAAELGKHGFLTTVALADQQLTPEERCVAELLDNSVDGLVLVGGRHAEVDHGLELYQELLDEGMPFVLVNGRATTLETPQVYCDEGAGARQAVAHLVELGHQRIGCLLGTERFVPTHRFVSGYRTAMAAAALQEPDDAIVETLFTLEGGRAGATRLLQRGITGIIAGNDLMALGSIHAATRAGLDVPAEVSVVGYDGTDLTALTNPPLTTLRQPFEDMAQLVVDALLSEIDGSRRFRDLYVFEPQLVARETTAARRPLVGHRR
jgi:alanine racemase